jgi:hypothetical protein
MALKFLRMSCFLACVLCFYGTLFSGDWRFGTGLTGGISRFEADHPNPAISPVVAGHFRAFPVPYFGLSADIGFSTLLTTNDPTDFKTRILPFEISGIFNFLPLSFISPYFIIGGGGVYWETLSNDSKTGDGVDSFLKTGLGVEVQMSTSFSWHLFGTWRLSMTDGLDRIWQGNENDQVVELQTGFTYYFDSSRRDRDHDWIKDETDLMPDIAEDGDGYLDHDGVPEKNPPVLATTAMSSPAWLDADMAPVVVHHNIRKAEAGRSVGVEARIFSGKELRVAAVLYRPVATSNWEVVNMSEQEDGTYFARIPEYAVIDPGFQYCVVAVDETMKGVGYSGLPSRPITVETHPNGTPFRIIGGVLGTAAIGTATYMVIKKQE